MVVLNVEPLKCNECPLDCEFKNISDENYSGDIRLLGAVKESIDNFNKLWYNISMKEKVDKFNNTYNLNISWMGL